MSDHNKTHQLPNYSQIIAFSANDFQEINLYFQGRNSLITFVRHVVHHSKCLHTGALNHPALRFITQKNLNDFFKK